MSKIINDKGEVEYLTAEQIIDRILRDEVKIAARQFDDIGLRARLMGSVSPFASTSSNFCNACPIRLTPPHRRSRLNWPGTSRTCGCPAHRS